MHDDRHNAHYSFSIENYWPTTTARYQQCGNGSTRGVQVKRKNFRGHVVRMKNGSSGALAVVSVDFKHIMPKRTGVPLTELVHTAHEMDLQAAALAHTNPHFGVIRRLECVESGRFDLSWKRIELNWSAHMVTVKAHTHASNPDGLIPFHVLIYAKRNDCDADSMCLFVLNSRSR